jgi:CheY-like chemotaxis protein
MHINMRGRPDGNPEKRPILIVDDDLDDVALLKEALKDSGLAIPMIQLGDGEQALRYLSAAAPYENRSTFPIPSLVLLDLKMPKRTGFEVLAWIRTQPELCDLAVIVMTGSIREDDKQRARALGASDYQVKPVGFGELVRIVRELSERWVVEFSNTLQVQ